MYTKRTTFPRVGEKVAKVTYPVLMFSGNYDELKKQEI